MAMERSPASLARRRRAPRPRARGGGRARAALHPPHAAHRVGCGGAGRAGIGEGGARRSARVRLFLCDPSVEDDGVEPTGEAAVHVLGAQQATLPRSAVDHRLVHVRLVHDVRHQRLGARGPAPRLGQAGSTDPSPRCGGARLVETAETPQELGAREHVGRAREVEVATADVLSQLRRRERRRPPQHPAVGGRNRQPGGVDEVGVLGPGEIELYTKLVQAPAVRRRRRSRRSARARRGVTSRGSRR